MATHDIDNNTKNNTKVCVTCKQRKPIRQFDIPRHRTCSACRAIITGVASLPPRLKTILNPALSSAVKLSPRDTARILSRERQRRVALAKQQHKPIDPTKRVTCRRCRNDLPMSQMGNHGYGRICLFCEAVEREGGGRGR